MLNILPLGFLMKLVFLCFKYGNLQIAAVRQKDLRTKFYIGIGLSLEEDPFTSLVQKVKMLLPI